MDAVQLRETIRDSLVSEVEYPLDLFWERQAFLPIDVEVVPPPPGVVGLVDYQTVRVDGELRLDGVLLPLSRVVGLPLRSILWSRNLLLRCVHERLEAREVPLDLYGPKPLHLPVELLRRRN